MGLVYGVTIIFMNFIACRRTVYVFAFWAFVLFSCWQTYDALL